MTTNNHVLVNGYPSLANMAGMLRNGACTSVELTRHALQRIHALNDRLHAFVAVYEQEALAAAEAADRLIRSGCSLGPLHGIPVALKDNININGRPSTAGSTLLAHNIASSDAWITHRLKECGAIIVGKTHMVEFALGAWGTNAYMGTPRNPWGNETHLSPGGSSSGSAVAVAAGMVPLAIGTDTGASVRVPAALCGITGFKPTIGQLPGDGVVPLSKTLDSVGVMTQTAEDAALSFTVLSDKPANDSPSLSSATPAIMLEGLRVAVLSTEQLDGVQPEILHAYQHAIDTFKNQGAHIQPLVLPISFDEIADIQSTIMLSEAAARWGHLAANEDLKMDASVRPRIMAGTQIRATQYVNAIEHRDKLKRVFANQLKYLDVFLTPSTQWTARPITEVDHGKPPVRYARIGNLLELCGISVQLGEDDNGLPIGLQIAGPNNGDMRVLEVAQSFQACTDWHQRRWVG